MRLNLCLFVLPFKSAFLLRTFGTGLRNPTHIHNFAKMSSDQDKSPATAKITGDELIWDSAESGKDTRVFNEWIGLPTTGEVREATHSTAENRPHPTAGCVGPWEIFVPKEGHYAIWEKSPNKERHVSFGDNGTTASANGVGDLIQISQYLGAGRSGVFTIDQCSTPEP